jgi:hypothetical protein
MGAPRLAAFLIAALMALVAAGCGGSDAAAPQVPGPPADVTIPESSTAPTAAASASADKNSSDSSSTDSSSSDSSSSTDTGSGTSDTGTGTTGDSSGGTTSPDTSTGDSATNDTAPPAGSNAQQFEDFCAQNPGAC